MDLSISQSNIAMPAIGPSPVTADDLAQMVPEGYFATRQRADISTTEAVVEVTTAQGDQVTLTCRSSLTDYTYIREEGIDAPGLIDGQVSSQTVSIEVQGELSQEEQDDIAGLQEDLGTLISSGLETDDDTSQSMLSTYDTLSRFTLNVQTIKAKTSAEEMTIVAYPGYTAQNITQSTDFLESAGGSDAVSTYLSLIV